MLHQSWSTGCKEFFTCISSIPQKRWYIPRPLLHQSWSTGCKEYFTCISTITQRRWYKMRGTEERKEMFYLTTHSTHFIYGYMASDIWLRTILIVRKETRCRHISYSFRLTARVLLYAQSNRQDNTYHGVLAVRNILHHPTETMVHTCVCVCVCVCLSLNVCVFMCVRESRGTKSLRYIRNITNSIRERVWPSLHISMPPPPKLSSWICPL